MGETWTTVNILRTGQFFGDHSYLLGTEYMQEHGPVKYVVLTESAVITQIPFSQLDYLFHRNPSLALHFFKFQTFILAQLFIFQTYILHSPSLPKNYMYFIHQLNRFL